MSFLNGIGLSSLVSQYQNTGEQQTLRDIQSSSGGVAANGYFTLGHTSRHKTQLANLEVQSEDNTTFLFEFRAFLNSQLTTLVTKLTNALTSDLDAVMQSTGDWDGGVKSNMQGNTGIGGPSYMDPGAARTAWMYTGAWADSTKHLTSNDGGGFSGTGGSFNTGFDDQDAWNPAANPTPQTPSGGYARQIKVGTNSINATGGGDNDNTVAGTIAVMTYGNSGGGDFGIPDDTLFVYLDNPENNRFKNNKRHKVNVTDDEADQKGAGTKLQEVLHKEARTRTFQHLLRAGLFKDLVISATSSISTGSQVQASITLQGRLFQSYQQVAGKSTSLGYTDHDYFEDIDDTNDHLFGAVDMFVNKFTAFYHT